MTIHIFFTYPETARRTLEEVDMLFDSKIKPWKSAKVHSHDLESRAQKIEEGAVSESEKEKDGEVNQKEVV